AREAALRQMVGEVCLRRALVARRVDRVEAHQVAEQLLRLRGRLGGLFRAPRAERTPIAVSASRLSGKWQAARVPVSRSSSGGSSSEQSSCAFGQRVWKRQALGGFAGLGTSPLSRRRSPARAAGSATGTADSSAPVYGWRGRSYSASLGPIS